MTNFFNRNLNSITPAPLARRSAEKPAAANMNWTGVGKEVVILNQVRNHKDYSGFTGKKPRQRQIS
ncbi:MAG: hypothetical protein ACKVZH_21310 [Blastocatellia bacterium]